MVNFVDRFLSCCVKVKWFPVSRDSTCRWKKKNYGHIDKLGWSQCKEDRQIDIVMCRLVVVFFFRSSSVMTVSHQAHSLNNYSGCRTHLKHLLCVYIPKKNLWHPFTFFITPATNSHAKMITIKQIQVR